MSDRLDRILASEEFITPSIGFVGRVMEAVRRSRDFMAPIRFPWPRFAAGLVGGLICTLATMVFLLAKVAPGRPFLNTVISIQALPSIDGIGVFCLTLVVIGSLLAIRLSIAFTSE